MELLWGNDPCEGCADMGGADACGLRRWDRGWNSYGATIRRMGCADMVGADACGLRQ